jgi:hypothetical protein
MKKKSDVAVGDQVVVSLNGGHFTPDKVYTVKNSNSSYITVIDNSKNPHQLSFQYWEYYVPDTRLTKALDLIGKRIFDNGSYHTVKSFEVYTPASDTKDLSKFAQRSRSAILSVTDFVVILFCNDGKNFDMRESTVITEDIVVPLNDTYKAIVTKEGIRVGCQTFSPSIVKELQNALNKLNS